MITEDHISFIAANEVFIYIFEFIEQLLKQMF